MAGPVLLSQPAAPVGPALSSLVGSSLSGALGSPQGAENDTGNVRAQELNPLMASSLNAAL